MRAVVVEPNASVPAGGGQGLPAHLERVGMPSEVTFSVERSSFNAIKLTGMKRFVILGLAMVALGVGVLWFVRKGDAAGWSRHCRRRHRRALANNAGGAPDLARRFGRLNQLWKTRGNELADAVAGW